MDDVANEVAVECKGLALDIVIVGSVLREKDADEWTVVSQKLKDSKSIDIEDVNVNIYACPKLNYDYLKGENANLCFLFCSLFLEDCKIDLDDIFRILGLLKLNNTNPISRSKDVRHNLKSKL